ncbi:flagellar protein FlaG [Desulfovibrio ferrophilus]|uniref:Flagellar protein FlaG protein n=1 Tax=Desulfovibrio ferrophilus TaxID=241368 RepID=A0A2Z6B0C0_9BACT|nr:flagellar protein FlaG [Desulfovibrio ferrophilus]BBD08898.1 flagellar protein FlaG protein [Desulfovibrio ferrophilus]
MDYTSIQLTASDGYGKNFRIQKDTTAQSAVRVNDRTDPHGVEDNTAATKTQDQADKPSPAERLLKMTEPVEKFMQSAGVSITFHIHEETDQIQAEVKSADGEKVIRKIPADDILKLVASIKEMSDSEHMVDTAF